MHVFLKNNLWLNMTWNGSGFRKKCQNVTAFEFNYVNGNNNGWKPQRCQFHILDFTRGGLLYQTLSISPFVLQGNQESKDSVRLHSHSPQRTCLPPCSAPSRTCPRRPVAKWAWPEIPGPPGAAAWRCSHTPPQPGDALSPAGCIHKEISTYSVHHWNDQWACFWFWELQPRLPMRGNNENFLKPKMHI